MTQEVEPLTWQKRTNLEEHQQFFSKINEIIANLAPTVDEAEAAIAQATAAIASANAASAAASAAATQAQTAASTVAGYDTRLTVAEGDIDALQAADQTMAGNITALGTRMTAAETKNSQQDTAIGALQTADANNVKITGTHKIGDYAVLLTGNQDPIAGEKTFANNLKQKNAGWSTIPRIYQIANVDSLVAAEDFLYLAGGLTIRDMNDRTMWSIACYRDTGGRDVLSFEGNASDGTTTGYFHLELGPNGYRKITTNFDKPSTW